MKKEKNAKNNFAYDAAERSENKDRPRIQHHDYQQYHFN